MSLLAGLTDPSSGQVPIFSLLHHHNLPACHSGAAFSKLHRAMLKRGVYLVPSHYEAMYTSMAHINANLATFHNSFAPQA
jgi:glutamate-1-semialdehyde aminotransferase